MRLSGHDKVLLACGTFSLPDGYKGEIHSQAAHLLAQGLITQDEIEMVGETRFSVTKKGFTAVQQEGTYERVKVEEVKVEEVLPVQIKAGDKTSVSGAESSAGQNTEDKTREV